MNKRILSLVCIAGYLLLAVSIHCSQQKISNAENKSVCGIKEENRRNEKNGIEFKRETQLKNNNPKGDTELKNYNISKRDIQAKECLNNKLNLLIEIVQKTAALNDYIAKNPKALKFLLLLKQELKQLSNDKKYPLKVTFSMDNIIREFTVNDPKDLKFLLLIIESLNIHHPIDIELKTKKNNSF
ncbi:hypothetical protein YYG_04635 [Plasmodium vinckei petteri]|uniref:Fam-c protein n=1 Tax=Plasmodium vinckei petteri TaxID=138298 RepID=W7A9X7_PLAVN|nr:hypothetical protein YYG_04635 [Plasmodium vinckei petteri]CAD2095588.1 fam-c protein [Plasmodium vinckei petteri]